VTALFCAENTFGAQITATASGTQITINSNPSAVFISNTAARDLINDRIQVANVTTLLAGKEDAGEGIAFAIALG